MLKIFILSIIIYSICIIIKTNKSLQMLQQNRYNRGNKYLKWLKSNIKKNYLTIELIIIFLPLLFLVNKEIIPIIFNTMYFIITLVLNRLIIKEKTKLPLKYTGRIIRLFITTLILYIIPITIISFIFTNNNILIYYILLSLLSYFNNLIVVLANIINMPIERLIGLYFKKKSQNKLKQLSNLEVIGITGSYGKTSSKNILNDILNIKYNSLASPKNFNTPFGLMITINDYLDKFNDFFIAEMGACKKGEIKELCDLVHPKYGIITKIGLAHLETFGSEENILKTKFELIESLPSDGIGVLNADDPLQVNYHLKNNCQIIWIGIENEKASFRATNIKLSNKGTTFDCYVKEENKTYSFTTQLLGKANIYNLLAGIALAKSLGVSYEQIALGVKKVKPVEHRLELKRYYDMYLIDDAYNANLDGSKMALDVLDMMKGQKIVISSGIIELGSKSYEINKELGCYMANKTDIAILIGKEQTKPIYDGLISQKFPKKNIIIFNDIMDSFKYLKDNNKRETYILLQSDLPDIFNEK